MENWPIKLDDIFSFNINFDNLIKIIKILHNNNLTLSKDIKDMQRRINVIDDFKTTISDWEIKSKSYETNILEMSHTMSNFTSKFMEIERKVIDLTSSNAELKNKIIQLDSTANSHENNINNINRVWEDQIKTTKDNDTKNEELKSQVLQLELKVGKNSEETKKIENKIDEDTKTLFTRLGKNEAALARLDESIEKKNTEMDKTVSNLITSISEIRSKLNNVVIGIGSSQTVNANQNYDHNQEDLRTRTNNNITGVHLSSGEDSNLVRLTWFEIEKIKTKYDSYIKENNEYKEKNDKNQINNNVLIKAWQGKIEEINIKIFSESIPLQRADNEQRTPWQSSTSNNGLRKCWTKRSIDSSNDLPINEGMINTIFASSPFKKLNDSVRIISNTIGNKVNKEELSEINEQLIKKLSKLEDKLNEKMSFYDNKINDLKNGGDKQNQNSNTQNFDFDFFTQNFENQITEQIRIWSTEIFIQEMGKSDLTMNPSFNAVLANIRKHSNELDEAYKSIVDIRSALVSNEWANDIQDLKTRIDYHELEGKSTRQRIEKIMQMLEGDEDDDAHVWQGLNEQPQHSGNIKNKINMLLWSNEGHESRINSLEQLSSKLAQKIREDLNTLLKKEITETNKAFNQNLENMKIMLKDSIQSGLKNPLHDWEEKMRSTFNSKINSKLDKKEWNTNNCQINRKIDYLENKISKTLVDTIIDLQMDEAPLVVKKNARNEEKCASCNQILPTNNGYYSTDKFRSTRYGTGNHLNTFPNIYSK